MSTLPSIRIQLGLTHVLKYSTKRRIETDVMKLQVFLLPNPFPHLTLPPCRLMSDYEVTLVNDNMREFYVRFHGPPESVSPRVLASQAYSHIPQLHLQAEYGRYTLSCKLTIHTSLPVLGS